jgi:hypothetical protein
MLNNKSINMSVLFSARMVTRFLMLALMMISATALAINPFAETESREVEAFNEIVVGGLVNVEIKQGKQAGIEVSAFGIELEDILTKVKDGTLTVTTNGYHRGESISVEVTYETLTAIKTSGAATIETDGPIKAETLRIVISDAGDADLELNVQELNVEMRGNGNLELKGHAQLQNFKSHGGGGRLDNSDLRVGQQ